MGTTEKTNQMNTTHEVEVDTRIAEAYGDFLAAAYDAKKNDIDPTTTTEYEVWQSAENEYDGWSRFFAVPGGHIHSSMNCSTCNRWTSNGQNSTAFAWFPILSGLTHTEAIAAHGPTLCSVCFPNAPVAHTTKKIKIADPVQAAIMARHERRQAEAQAEYEAAITPELDAAIVAFFEAEAAHKASDRPYGVGPVAEAAHNAYAALAAAKPDGFNYYRRAQEMGVRC